VRKGQLESTTISRHDPKFEPLAYPILFPYGEDGWSKKGGLKFMDYITSRMLMPEDGVYYASGDGEHIFPSNRFQLWHRLGQVYHCDQISRMIDDHLAYQRYHSNKVSRAVEVEEQHDGVVDGVDDDGHEDGFIQDGGGNVGGDAASVAYAPGSVPSFLSDRFHGSRRNLKKKAINALHLVSTYGKASCFLTVTCNTKWPELVEALPPGQSAYDSPLITSMVFHHRLDALLKNLRTGAYFNGQ
jgi:hypothetical protein